MSSRSVMAGLLRSSIFATPREGPVTDCDASLMEADTRWDVTETNRDEAQAEARKRMHAKRPWRRRRKGAWVMAGRLGVIGGCCEVGATGQEGEQITCNGLARRSAWPVRRRRGPHLLCVRRDSSKAPASRTSNSNDATREHHAALPTQDYPPTCTRSVSSAGHVRFYSAIMAGFGSSAISTLCLCHSCVSTLLTTARRQVRQEVRPQSRQTPTRSCNWV